MFFIRLFLANTWKKNRGSPCSFERKGAVFSLSGLVLRFVRARAHVRANEAKIVRSRNAQCNTLKSTCTWKNSPALAFIAKLVPAQYWQYEYGLLQRLSYDLEKVFVVCFTNQCLARLKQGFSLFPPRKFLIWAVNSSISQSHYCISKDVKAPWRWSLSIKFHREVTLFTSAFAKPMKIRTCLFLFDKPIKCFCIFVYVLFLRLFLKVKWNSLYSAFMYPSIADYKYIPPEGYGCMGNHEIWWSFNSVWPLQREGGGVGGISLLCFVPWSETMESIGVEWNEYVVVCKPWHSVLIQEAHLG